MEQVEVWKIFIWSLKLQQKLDWVKISIYLRTIREATLIFGFWRKLFVANTVKP